MPNLFCRNALCSSILFLGGVHLGFFSMGYSILFSFINCNEYFHCQYKSKRGRNLGMIRNSHLFNPLSSLKKEQQYAVVASGMVKLRIFFFKYYRHESIIQWSQSKCPLKICAWVFITLPFQSSVKHDNYCSWLSVFYITEPWNVGIS